MTVRGRGSRSDNSPCTRCGELQWVPSTDAMLDAVRSLDLSAGDGYAWCAGEASAMASLRRLLIQKGLDRHAMRVAAYLKRNAIAHHENLAECVSMSCVGTRFIASEETAAQPEFTQGVLIAIIKRLLHAA